MKIFQVNTTGFGRQLYLAETAEAAIEEFKKFVARCDKLNGVETSPTDTVILAVRRLGIVVNFKTL
jgi:hypothetical protein